MLVVVGWGVHTTFIYTREVRFIALFGPFLSRGGGFSSDVGERKQSLSTFSFFQRLSNCAALVMAIAYTVSEMSRSYL